MDEETKQLIKSFAQTLDSQNKALRSLRHDVNGILAAQRQCNQMLAAIQQAWADLYSDGRCRRPPSGLLLAIEKGGG